MSEVCAMCKDGSGTEHGWVRIDLEGEKFIRYNRPGYVLDEVPDDPNTTFILCWECRRTVASLTDFMITKIREDVGGTS